MNEKNDKKKNFVQELSSKIMNNIKLLVKNVHIRFEDEDIIVKNRSFGIGLFIEKIKIQPSNEQFEENTFIDHSQD
jgi:hypothetical protein